MMADKPQTIVRWSAELAAEAKIVARVDGVSVNTLISEAIAEHVSRRRADTDFRARLRERIEANQRLLSDFEEGA